MSPKASAEPPQPQTSPEFNVFLSYNRSDAPAVHRIRELLTSRKVRAFLDSADLGIGLPWLPEVQKALHKSQAAAVFLGPSGPGRVQESEIQLAVVRYFDLRETRPFPVIPVLLPNADLDKIPPILKLNTWIDLRGGLEDSGALDKLASAILGAGKASADQPAIELCPYLGLEAFGEEHSRFFFGREDFSELLCEKVVKHPVTAVVGPSGSGKSSVVQAGLLPLLRRQGSPGAAWAVVTFKPHDNPFYQLAEALFPIIEPQITGRARVRGIRELEDDLRGTGDRRLTLGENIREALRQQSGLDHVLIVADQFEELFALTAQGQRIPFIGCLLEEVDKAPFSVLLTLRADYLGYAIASSRDLNDRLQEGQVLIGPMKRDELKRVIEEPARQVGLQIDPVLAERLLQDVEHGSGNLPLLEFALKELWDKRVGNRIPQDAYQLGDVARSIATRAEKELKDYLGEASEQEVARNLLCRLVRLAEGGAEGADTRSRVLLAEFGGEERKLILQLSQARLLVTSTDRSGNEVVEVAHEALIRNWPLLQEWITEDREFLLWRQRFRLFLLEWERTQRDQGVLLGGAPLADARGWLKKKPGGLTEGEKEFIRQSIRKQRRAKKPLQWAAAALLAALLAAGGGWLWTRSDSYQVTSMLAEAAGLYGAVDEEDALNLWLQCLALTGHREAALDEARRRPDPGLAQVSIAQALFRAGESEAGEQVLNEALPSLPIEFDFSRARTLIIALVQAGRTSEAQEAARRAERPIEHAKLMSLLVDELMAADRLEEALQAVSGPRQIPDQDMHPLDEADILGQIAEMQAKVGQTEEALALARGISFPTQRYQALQVVIHVLAQKGETAKAREVATEIKDPLYHSAALARIAEGLAATGDFEQARMEVQRALELARSIEDPFARMIPLFSIPEILAKAGDASSALVVVRKELDPSSERPEVRAPTLTAVGRVLASGGHIDAAWDVFREAGGLLREISRNESRSKASADLAVGLGQIRRYRSARILAAAECLPSHRLIAYGSILLIIAQQDAPHLEGLFVDPKTRLIRR